MKKLLSAAAASICAVSALSSFSAIADSIKINPVYALFNNNDVNGSVVVTVPDKTTAEISILMDSPEGKAEPYYNFKALAGGSYSFDIEGRDNTDDDYRIYTLSVVLTGGQYNISSAPYTDTFTVPDVNDNPDSFVTLNYNLSVDDTFTGNSFDVTKKDNTRNIAVHLDSFMLGDIDGDGKISAADATAALIEYSARSTGQPSTLDARQLKSADVNKDGTIDASDATRILIYYSALSTDGNASWD